MGYLNKVVDKKGQEADLQDIRIPEVSAQDEGKILKVGENGFEWGSAGGGSEPLEIDITNDSRASTIQDLLDATGNKKCTFSGIIRYTYLHQWSGELMTASLVGLFVIDSPNDMTNIYLRHSNFKLDRASYGAGEHGDYVVKVEQEETDAISDFSTTIHSCFTNSVNGLCAPNFPVTVQSKTYILKCVNGTLSWVEDSGSVGGTQLYMHYIEAIINDGSSSHIYLYAITNSDEAFTLDNGNLVINHIVISANTETSEYILGYGGSVITDVHDLGSSSIYLFSSIVSDTVTTL